MEIGTLLEEPDRATAATYWDSTGLTGVELGRPKKTEGGGGGEAVGHRTGWISLHSVLGLCRRTERIMGKNSFCSTALTIEEAEWSSSSFGSFLFNEASSIVFSQV